MNWLSRNWLGLVVCAALLIVALSAFYYFVLFLPEEHRFRLEMERQEKSAVQKHKEENQEREERRIEEEQSTKQHNSELLEQCLSNASSNYTNRWNSACKEGLGHLGQEQKENCSLPEWMADDYIKDYNNEKEDCFRRFPQR